ncbi:MAG: hypothetical protein ACTSPY_06225 [Candidatus Helarchaeota archaeon]
MPCPRCGKDTPRDSFCSIECMKLYTGKKIDEEKQLKERYEMLDRLTEDFNICPFCNIKLRISKPKESETEKNLLEKNKYCPKCYRVYGFLLGTEEDETWTFKKIPFEDAKQLLHDLREIINNISQEE